MGKTKMTKMIISVLGALSLCAGFVVPTAARYVTEKETGPLDYTVANKFTVETQEDFFNALNQGYSYIQLGDDIKNPLVITRDPASLNKDLILDLNGKEIQRNSRDPIVNVVSGTSLTITDTSINGTGGLYNPVGSVLNVNGGTLSVTMGKFESGPRFTEYYSYNLATRTSETVVQASAVNYYEQNGDGTATLKSSDLTAAVILPRVTPLENDELSADGNLYFDEAYTASDYDMAADSYCYYTTDENNADHPDPATASYYYSYYVDKDDHSYVGTQGRSGEEDILVTVYVYEKDIETAATKTNPEDRYAAIKMQSGALEVTKGSFHTYFGVTQSACVQTTGGTITVEKDSQFYATVPSTNPTDTDYLENFSWVGGTYTAEGGASVCITCNKPSVVGENYQEPKLNINKGTFAADNNNLVHVEVGELSIGGGEFTKYATTAKADLTDKTDLAAICMLGGKFTLQNAVCNVTGNDVVGIYSTVTGDDNFLVEHVNFNLTGGDRQTGVWVTKGKLVLRADNTATDGRFDVSGENSYGVVVGNGGKVDATNYTFDVAGANSVGIYTESGGVDAQGGQLIVRGCNFTLEGESAMGIQSKGGTITIDGTADNTCNFTFYERASRGISLQEGTAISVSLNYGYFEFYKEECIGIYSVEAGDTIAITNSLFQFDEHDCCAAYSKGGTITSSSSVYDFEGERSNGIHIESGKITTTNDELIFKGAGSYGINTLSGTVVSNGTTYVMNGAPTYKAGGALDVTSKGIVTSGGSITVNGGSITMEDATSCYGVYAYADPSNDAKNTLVMNGAKLTIGAMENGVSQTTAKTQGNKYAASVGIYLCDAAGSITVQNGIDMACEEVAIAVSAGTLHLKGKVGASAPEEISNAIITRRASAVVVKNGSVYIDDACQYTIESTLTPSSTDNAKNAYEITLPTGKELTEIRDYQNTDGLYVSGGDLYVNGSLDLTHTGLYNDQDYYSYGDFVVKSYAVRVTNGEVHFRKNPTLANATAPTIDVSAKQGGGVGVFDNDTSDEDTAHLYMGSLNGGETVSVKAEGQKLGNEYHAYPTRSLHSTWKMKRSLDGGHAVAVNGGAITIYSGSYQTNYGNGVQATGGGNVSIYDGVFLGWMTQGTLTGGFNDTFFTSTTRSGPGAHYGLKVIGAATVNIYGGRFDGGNGGAFITGVSVSATGQTYGDVTHTYTSPANVLIYKGTFGSGNLDGFNIYNGSNVVFGAYKKSDSAVEGWTESDYQNAIKIVGNSCSMAMNPMETMNIQENNRYITNAGGTKIDAPIKVSVYYGSYVGKDNIVYTAADANMNIYNNKTNKKLTAFYKYYTDGVFTDELTEATVTNHGGTVTQSSATGNPTYYGD